ncbi:MAG: PTS sugar transporter subunit IIC [Peptococcaceae bacterium]|nr:PTS sugar transporter subunit IIC [Peptococcaceae bacterium]
MKKQGISITFDRICIKALGAMAHGLFASLLIGTIIKTIGQNVPALSFMVDYGNYASSVTGAAMAVSIGYALQSPPFVLYSLLAVGAAANTLGGAGGPLAVFFIALIAIFAGKLVSKTTPIDLIATPFVTIMVGVFAATILAPPIGKVAILLGELIYKATNLQPFFMGIIVSAAMGIILTLPISSAAVCAALGLVGLAGGAAVAGCSAHMVGFAVASYRENKVGGLMAQGIGTSMLQVPNLMRKPVLWTPAVVASIVNGPVATVIFKLKMNGAPISSGMGTSGLVGQIGVWSGWLNPSETALNFGETAISPTAMDWIGLILISFVIPAVVAWLTSEFMRKKGVIKDGDLKIEC